VWSLTSLKRIEQRFGVDQIARVEGQLTTNPVKY